MAVIEMKELAHSYLPNPTSEEDFALRKMDMTWADGGAYALLGPSGCGKSTLLNIISGLLPPSHGKLYFDGKDITNVPTRDRNIAQVFQFPVVYDTMTVFDNLAFPLRNRKVPEPEIKKRVEEMAEMLDLNSILKNRASGLTPDLKQIISLGRGIIRKDVSAVLFDEPLTVIDPHIKWLLRRRIKQIHEQFGLTMIFVTHDQTEALTFATDVVVLHDGIVLQEGTPQELFENPTHAFVGYFIGSPGMNLLDCQIEGNKAILEGQLISLSDSLTELSKKHPGKLKLGIRPEYCELVARGAPDSFAAKVIDVENHGDYKLLIAQIKEQKIHIKVQVEEEVAEKTERWFSFPKEYIRLYDNDHSITKDIQ